MNVKNNKRKQASVEKIRKSFFELLRKKELSQIKVSEICQLSHINRSTFYANYMDIYDLADLIFEELAKDVECLFAPDSDLNYCEEDFLRLFTHIKENQELYSFYFKLGYEKRRINFQNSCDLTGIGDKKAIDYRIEFFRNGFNAIVRIWLENGCRESPETMRDILSSEYRDRFK